MSDFWNDIQDYAENAPEAGYANVNFGQLTVTPMVVKWETKDGVRTPDKSPLKEGQAIKEGETLELNFKVNISEFNPQLEFDYERNVPVRKSGRVKTDWTELVEPSLIAVFGKQWAKAIVGKGKHPYVAVEDAANIAGKASSSGKVYGVPKFLAVYKSKEECGAAREERYHSRGSETTNNNGAEAGEGPAVTEAVLTQVQALIKSVGPKKAKQMLENKPFGDFDSDVLIELASAAAAS